MFLTRLQIINPRLQNFFWKLIFKKIKTFYTRSSSLLYFRKFLQIKMTITFSWSERIETFLTKSCNLRLFYIKSWKLAYSFFSTLILYFGATEILYMVFSRFEEVVALCPLRIINEWLISFTKYMRGDMHQDKFVLMVSILLFVKAKNIQSKVNKVHREINTEFG